MKSDDLLEEVELAVSKIAVIKESDGSSCRLFVSTLKTTEAFRLLTSGPRYNGNQQNAEDNRTLDSEHHQEDGEDL